jgi:hypothetical protein
MAMCDKKIFGALFSDCICRVSRQRIVNAFRYRPNNFF